jgi:hypothetical protein
MLSMPAGSWWRLGVWLGLAVYFLYAWRFRTAEEK